MAYKNLKPPVKILVDVNKFNLLVEFISTYKEERAINLKDKILRYSFPYKTDEGVEMISIGLFINEVRDLIDLFFNKLDDINITTNYYETLLENRKNIKSNSKSSV